MHLRILVILESDYTATQVAECLRQAGYQVVLCKDFATATEILQRQSISLIIADVHPENGGSVFDFLRYAKKSPSSHATPFVLFSLSPNRLAKYLEDGVRTTARLLNCDMFLSMDSFEENKFRKRIGSLLPPSQQSSINKKEGVS